MNTPIDLIETDAVDAISTQYHRAAEELLHAYQRNKEAKRHHERGAFRAALHHARLSCQHASAAHEYLSSALAHSLRLSAHEGLLANMPVAADRHEH